MISRAAIIKCLNTWLKRIGFVSGCGCHFIFRALFTLYIYLTFFLISYYFIIVDLQRESSSSQKLRLRCLVDLVALLPSFREDHHLSRNRPLYLVSHLFPLFHPIVHFCLFFFLERPLTQVLRIPPSLVGKQMSRVLGLVPLNPIV